MRMSLVYMILLPFLFWGVFIYIIVRSVKNRRKAVEQILRQTQGNADVPQKNVPNEVKRTPPPCAGNVPEEQPEDMGTMEYLQIKADRDAREHEREDYEFRQQIMRETGGAAVGERYIEGMSISPDKICVHCRYCGADNLLQRGAAGKCTCYFCREFL